MNKKKIHNAVRFFFRSKKTLEGFICRDCEDATVNSNKQKLLRQICLINP